MSIFDSFGSAALGATFGAIAGAAMDTISPNSSNIFDFCSDRSSMLNGAINGALIGGAIGASMDNLDTSAATNIFNELPDFNNIGNLTSY